MAIAHVQSRGSSGNSLAYSSPVSAGSLLVCAIGSAGNITAVSDTVNGAWTKAVDGDLAGSLVFVEIWYFANSAGGTPTVSFTGGFGGFEHISIAEYSGIDTASPLDKTAAATSNANVADVDSGATATTSQADELLVGAVCNDSGRTVVWSGSLTERYDGGGAFGSDRPVSLADRIVSAAGAYSTLATLSAGAHWAAAIATFKAAAGGGGGGGKGQHHYYARRRNGGRAA